MNYIFLILLLDIPIKHDIVAPLHFGEIRKRRKRRKTSEDK